MAEEIEINGKALAGGIIGGLIASSYAFGPLIMSLLGFNPVTSSLIVKYWIYVIITGVIVALIMSFSTTQKNISLLKSGILTSLVSFGLIFVIGVYALTPLLAPVVYGNTQQEITNGDYKVLTLSIPGMVCAGCSATIEGALKNTDGVVDAKVTLSNKQAVVIYEPAITTKEDIVNLEIFTSIYPATIIKEEDWKGG